MTTLPMENLTWWPCTQSGTRRSLKVCLGQRWVQVRLQIINLIFVILNHLGFRQFSSVSLETQWANLRASTLTSECRSDTMWISLNTYTGNLVLYPWKEPFWHMFVFAAFTFQPWCWTCNQARPIRSKSAMHRFGNYTKWCAWQGGHRQIHKWTGQGMSSICI